MFRFIAGALTVALLVLVGGERLAHWIKGADRVIRKEAARFEAATADMRERPAPRATRRHPELRR